MKDDASSVRLGSIEISAGTTSIGFDGVLPESSPVLQSLEAEVSYVTTEHRQPFSTSVAKSISGNSIVFNKTSNDDFEKTLYEIKNPAKRDSSALGYVKFKTNTSWVQHSADWCNLSLMAGPYFALEHGSFNTAIYGFLRNNGTNGSLVLGGPMQNFSTARPSQTEVPLNWLTLPNGTSVELWFFFNITGYNPSHIPVVEVWMKRSGVDSAPLLVSQIQMSLLGEFRKDTFPNSRPSPEDNLVLTFGLAGKNGDSLTVEDWKLFPDYRLSASEGMALSASSFSFSPDAPVFYRVSDGLTPEQVSPGRWFPVVEGSFVRPQSYLFYPPGKTTPYAMHFEKSNAYAGAFQKHEPRLETSEGGFIEAFMFGTQTTRVGDTFGSGIALDDGTNVYRAVMIETPAFKTIGIAKNDFDTTEAGYYLPASNINWNTPKLVRLSVDKTRATVSLFVEEVLELEVPLASGFPSSSGAGRVMFGNLTAVDSRGFSRFVEVNYSPRCRAYEPKDQLLPSAAPYSWTLVGPAAPLAASTVWFDPPTPDATSLVIDKEDPSLPGSAIYYRRVDDFSSEKGLFVDFETEFNYYADAFGHGFGSSTVIECGINIELGNKVLKFRFIECGLLGKFVGFVPGSGSEQDLINQTELGRSFSAPLDWLARTKFRLVLRGGLSIELWSGTLMQKPLITIPWRDLSQEFDLPILVSAPAISFGHFGDNSLSEVKWFYFRYGISNGYEVSVSQQYEGDLPAYLFGGSAFVRSEFDV